MTKSVTSNFPIFLPELPGSTNFLSRLVFMSQSFGKKINSQKSKKHFSWNFLFFYQA
ncbi:conserved hypothetical protein [Carnobacterium maltaromaticum]|nr:conserved hypothetical protein [Carnobacterium maltaromaticum]